MGDKKILLTTVITDIYGVAIQLQDPKEPTKQVPVPGKEGVTKEEPNFIPLTLREALVIGLDRQNNGAKFETNDAIEEDVDMYELIEKIQSAEDFVEVSSAQFRKIEKELARYWVQFGRIRMGKVLKALRG